MMVVVPVNAYVDEAQHIAQKYRDQRLKDVEALAMRHLQLQNHDGNDDGDHAIAECFEPALAHSHLSLVRENFHSTKIATAAGI
jgi:hypothetical protein